MLEWMLDQSMMELDQPVHYGHWNGRMELPDGQDMVVMKRGHKKRWKWPQIEIRWK